MIRTLKSLGAAMLLAALCLHPTNLAAQQPATAPAVADGKVTLDFRDIELTDLIKTISELTGKNFIYDDTVRGKVTIISPQSMSLDEAYQLFLTVLNVRDFTVVPSGNVNKIVANKNAKESNLPTLTDGPARAGENYVTRLVPLSNIDANLLATSVLTPLVPKTSSIVAFSPSNTLVITDSGANIDRLVRIIKQLDVPSGLEALEVITLDFASAEEVASIASQVLTQTLATPRRGRAAANVQTAGTSEMSKIIPYSRTNALVIMATADDLATIRGLVAKLDQKQPEKRSNINVYYLENADAETLAKTLNEILTGIKAQARTTPRQTAQAAAGAAQQVALVSEAVSITADKPTNSLIINATPEDYEILRGIIGQLDIKRKQVFVEALILELSMDATQNLGASLQGALDVGSDSVVFGTSNLNTGPAGLSDLASSTGEDGGLPTLLSRTINGILLGGLFNPITVVGPDGNTISVPALSALIDLSRTDSNVNILSAPRLLTSDNEEAEIIVGSNVPIITQRLTDTGGSAGLAQSVAVERQDVALTLRFTPQVTEGDLVRLNVFQEITDIATNSVGDVDQVGPTLTKRALRNTVLAENGKTVVLGGLIGTNVQETISKVPFLGDLPLLGWLFRSEGTQERKTNLLIFITPRIVRNAEDLAAVTRRSRDSMYNFQQEQMRSSLSSDYMESFRDNLIGIPMQDAPPGN
ncbi:type II secretion system protein GspD [Desulfuromonas versatilis]|uniref:Type II secretion system protein GspD n=1 Tax=Desulfuromonas versatilis TaxID=2802975 RepID=A0ABM8HVJ1_9BACT|nr:type II secretion system secretin GspD [Desulfuromonas versatilis]BCR05980.1 type II secretion system protein GspD [Desulfuromonas versatilis]